MIHSVSLGTDVAVGDERVQVGCVEFTRRRVVFGGLRTLTGWHGSPSVVHRLCFAAPPAPTVVPAGPGR